MDPKDTERLAKVEQKVDDARDDIADIKTDVKTIIGKIDSLDNRFITRLEGRAVYAFLGTCIALLAIYVSVKH